MKRIRIGFDEIAAFVLAFTLSFTAMTIYEDNVLKSVLICLGLTLLSFVVCHFVNEHRFIGTFGIIVFFILYFAVMLRLITIGEHTSGAYFWQWMVSGGDIQTLEIEAGSDSLIAMGMYMAVTVFFMVTVFYFSVPTYRFGYLTLVSLMPFVLYAKVTAEVENKYLVIVVLVSIVLHLICSRKVQPTREEYKAAKKAGSLFKHENPVHHRDWDIRIKGGSAFYLGFAIVAFVVLVASASVPKRSEARFYDIFEDIFLGGDTESAIDESFSNLADLSGNADDFREGSNRRLYVVTGDDTPYLKRQVFDIYDFDINRWYPENRERVVLEPSDWLSEQKLLSLTSLTKALLKTEEIQEGFLSEYGMEGLLQTGPIVNPVKHYNITAQNFGAGYYLTGSRICGVSLPETEDYCVSDKGTLYRKEGVHPKDLTYSIDVFDPNEGIDEFQKIGGMNMNAEESLNMLDKAEKILVNRAGEVSATSDLTDRENMELLGFISVVSAFKNDLIKAITYRDRSNSAQGVVPEEITELALDITKDCKYDWQKAVILESYFRNNDFVYDIKYKAPDDSPSYFLLEGKTGTCSDFASAFVLMAREAGLTVRYTEGFITDDTYGDMYQIITESESHAYAEVYLENVGWLSFDPTAGVPNANSGGFFELLKSLKVDTGLIRILGFAAIVMAFVVLMIKLLIPLMIEMIFRLRLAFAKPEKTLIPAYKRLLSKARKTGALKHTGIGRGAASECLEPTPGEFADFVAERGYDITGFIILIEKTQYAGAKFPIASVSEKEAKAVIRAAYSAASKAIKKKQK